MKFIDFHNHILPNCDDGSKSVDISLDMLREAQRQGITDVVNTIHYQHPKMENKRTDFKYISSIRDQLQIELIKNNIDIKIHLGAEVFFNFNLLDILDNELVTFSNMKYMLIEFEVFMLPKGYENHLYELAASGITPIIAHPERYRPIQNDVKIVEKLINSGCLMQVDAGSLIGHFGKRTKQLAEELIRRRMTHIMGSDSHNNRKRNFCLEEALKIAQNLIGETANTLVDSNPRKVLSGSSIEPFEILDNQVNKKSFFSFLNKK